MSIVRDIPLTIPSLTDTFIITCSTANQVVTATALTQQSTTAAAGLSGDVIDRLASLLTARFMVAAPFTHARATRGSTEANRQITLGVKLQHGDSSGGGDMADYSTGSTPSDRNFFSTARTSDMQVWDTTGSTGPFKGVTNPCYYDIRGAKRFVRAVHTASKNRQTTESSGDESFRIYGGITFMGEDRFTFPSDTGPASTSSST